MTPENAKAPLSVAIITKDEEDNLPRCLAVLPLPPRSLSWIRAAGTTRCASPGLRLRSL